ncbi:class I SAM-dependent methyltransferase [Iningainema tapete]|uniref:Methyltransferase type 11 domain-containing protein n=1 Tax=Iningainema tapete BLCC-T55 TaxID=2748662 RepID=A0A8J7BWT5_9CYAN|nr:methyltransferase domain-containing protein [Iningainema tapete]MBD2771543.1 hypothetical protein [Iningainema tapete BLCC-T55]
MTISQEEYIIWRQSVERRRKNFNEVAEGTWATTMAINPSSDVSKNPEQLVKLLDEQAQQQLTLGNTQISWIIRQHIRNISPTFINNLLQLIQLSITLNIFTPDLLKDWQVVELLCQNLTQVDPALLAQVFASTTDIFLKLDQESLQALNYVPSEQSDTESYQKAKKLLDKFASPYKVHIGCVKVKFDGWINIDKDEKLDTVDFVWNILNGLPFENDCCQFIYHEHLLQHLPVDKGVMFLEECYRILESGGVLRVAMPSLDLLYNTVTSLNWQNQDWLKSPEYQLSKTRAEMLNVAFRWWGHEWLYDREELERRLKEAGFTHLEFVEWGCSQIEELRNRETRKDSLLICEARK